MNTTDTAAWQARTAHLLTELLRSGEGLPPLEWTVMPHLLLVGRPPHHLPATDKRTALSAWGQAVDAGPADEHETVAGVTRTLIATARDVRGSGVTVRLVADIGLDEHGRED